jgi:hypothetical protein
MCGEFGYWPRLNNARFSTERHGFNHMKPRHLKIKMKKDKPRVVGPFFEEGDVLAPSGFTRKA